MDPALVLDAPNRANTIQCKSNTTSVNCDGFLPPTKCPALPIAPFPKAPCARSRIPVLLWRNRLKQLPPALPAREEGCRVDHVTCCCIDIHTYIHTYIQDLLGVITISSFPVSREECFRCLMSGMQKEGMPSIPLGKPLSTVAWH